MINLNSVHKSQKRYDLWLHVCKCLECEPTVNHEKMIKEVISTLTQQGYGHILKFHNESSGGRGLLDPLIPEGFKFCSTGKLFHAAYKEWDL